MPFEKERLKSFPTLPGVYLMKNRVGKILYIGKAKNLRSRVRQYFTPGHDGRVMVPFLTSQVESIETIVVASEKEALLLENNLIKKHQPKYNALLKDDKTFFSLMINAKHKWPMIRVVRYKGKPPSGNLYFGPYTHGYAARQTLELLRTLFPLRQCSDQELASRSRPCILYDMKRCIAPCVGKCSKDEYDHLVDQVIHFLRGHDTQIRKSLLKEREEAIEQLAFEKAQRIHETLEAVEKTLENQRVQKAGSEDLDVLGIYREADRVLFTQMIFREGKLLAAQDRFFSKNAQEEEELFTSFLLQHYQEKKELPKQILLPLTLPEQETIQELLSEGKERKITLLTPQKGNKKALVKMAMSNARAKFQQEAEAQHVKEQVLMEMEEKFKLTNYPERIECFDNSNLSGSEPVAAMVVFVGGEKASRHYRKFRIKTADPSDDYGALREVMTRRYRKAKEEGILPDLIVIDGGKGHLNVAAEILSDLDISTVDLLAVTKEEGRHDKGITAERVFLLDHPDPIAFSPHSPLLFLLQRIRDEAHRFAITFQKQRRGKKSLGSKYDRLPGIGPIKRRRLLTHFGSWKRVFDATPEEWKQVQGITQKDCETLLTQQSEEK